MIGNVIMVKILCVNDDGIKSNGLLVNKQAVEDLGEVLVVAPNEQQSGKGQSVSFFKPLKITNTILSDGSVAYGINGTPTDSVNIGMLKDKPDIVISGINLGVNMGKQRLTSSGTLGATLEAASYGIPAIAIALELQNQEDIFSEFGDNIDFSFAKTILRRIVKHVLSNGLPKGVVLNVNIPFNPVSDEIMITKLGEQVYKPKIIKSGENYVWEDGTYIENKVSGTDTNTVLFDKKISVTPLSIDLSVDIWTYKNLEDSDLSNNYNI
jgi:5'-nucleotidase